MSTNLVVMTKPKTINTYQDNINGQNLTVLFYTMTYDAFEFDEAQPETIQEEFWKFKETHVNFQLDDGIKSKYYVNGMLDGKVVIMLNALYGTP